MWRGIDLILCGPRSEHECEACGGGLDDRGIMGTIPAVSAASRGTLARGVAGMTGGAALRGRAGGSCPGDMRAHVHRAQLVDEVGGVVALVGPEGESDGSIGARS